MSDTKRIQYTLKYLQQNRDKLLNLSDIKPVYSNYLIENTIQSGHFLGTIREHYNSFHTSQTKLGDHLALYGPTVSDNDILIFTFEDGQKIKKLLE